MALFLQHCFTSKSWGNKCNLLGSVLMFCRTDSHLLEELFHARFTFNFLLCVYILEGVGVVVLEIVMRDNILIQKIFIQSRDSFSSLLIFIVCSLRLQEVLLGSFTCNRMLSEYRINVCRLSLGIAAVVLLESSQGCRVLASGNNRNVSVILQSQRRNMELQVSPITAGCE